MWSVSSLNYTAMLRVPDAGLAKSVSGEDILTLVNILGTTMRCCI
jgi:hypothetical protein